MFLLVVSGIKKELSCEGWFLFYFASAHAKKRTMVNVTIRCIELNFLDIPYFEY